MRREMRANNIRLFQGPAADMERLHRGDERDLLLISTEFADYSGDSFSFRAGSFVLEYRGQFASEAEPGARPATCAAGY